MTHQLTDKGRSISIRCNGREMSLSANTTVLGLLESRDRDPRTVAVEYNGEILPRDRFALVRLSEGDQVEIVQFVQGG
jgi:thiamine biosynthesis protein ThiS